jgi:molybdopterin/thiamine biosynthesis adenylyltransferase
MTMPAWSEEQARRYSRHLVLKEVDAEGQRKLLESRVLLVGVGGLGSPAALYLAAAGVGTLGVADFDEVEVSNLQRQIAHHVHDLGWPKVDSAAEAIADINPDVQVVRHREGLSAANALEIIAGYDVVMSTCDNFPTRYLVNNACVLTGRPMVEASVFRFEGQATVFLPGRGCYRCLYPEPPPRGTLPPAAETGLLGVLPGILGTIQALETIKLLLGIGTSLVGRLLVFDALTTEFRTLRIRRNPSCPLCGDKPTITGLVDYAEFCGVPFPGR